MSRQSIPLGQKIAVCEHASIRVARINGEILKDSQNPYIYTKVPWALLHKTMMIIPEAKAGDHSHRCTQFWEDEKDICGTFVIKADKSDILWSDTIKSDFRKLGYEKDPPAVTKRDIVDFCHHLFTPAIDMPNVKNHKRDWFVTMMIMRAAHIGEVSSQMLQNAQNELGHRKTKPPPAPIIILEPPADPVEPIISAVL
jgi:hypothetical protein